MKKKILATLIGVMTISACLTGCGATERAEKAEAEVEQLIVEKAASDEKVEEQQKEIEELKKENEELKDTVAEKEEEIEQIVSENAIAEEEAAEATEKKVVDPYSGLAVANCHSVTLPKGTDYNDAIDAVIKGTSAYPKTFPNIYNVDFNTPGVYECYWEREMDDGNIVPLDYARFTVTITE